MLSTRIKAEVMKAMTVFVVCLSLVIMAGCTRHNGDIGDLFGEWRLERLTADGQETELYDDSSDGPLLYTWAFQGNIIRINTIYAHNRVFDCFGTWMRDDDLLELCFIYHDNSQGTDYLYNPPEAMCFSPDGVTRLHIDRLTGKKMEVSYTSADGVEYRYYLTHPH